MNSKQALAHGPKLAEALKAFFQEHYSIRCGKHWINVPPPEQMVKKLITTDFAFGEKMKGHPIVRFNFVVKTLDPMFLMPNFDVRQLSEFIGKTMEAEVGGEWIDFYDSAIVFSLKKDNYNFHIGICHKL